jgi:site-specific recombinase XerD
MTIKEAFSEFVAEYEYRGCTEQTIGFYKEQLRYFQKSTGETQLEEFNEAKIRAWLVSHRKLSPNTLQTYDKALRVVARWFHTRGFVGEFPMAELPKPKGRSRTIAVFSVADIRAMLEDAKNRREGSRDKALILLLLDTGIRIGEAHTLALHNINWAENFIAVSGKTGERIVPFGPRSKRAMRSYIDVERRAANTSIKQVFLTRVCPSTSLR